MRRRLLLAILVLGLSAPAVLACTGLLGIRELPLRDNGDSAVDATAADVADGGECDARGPTFCGKLCPVPDFCDDFEGESPSFERWSGTVGLPNTLVTLEGGVSLVADERNGQIVFAEARSGTSSPAFSLLSHELLAPKGTKPRGVQFRMEAKLGGLTFDAPEAGKRDRYFYYFAFADTRRNEGIAIVLLLRDDMSIDILLQQRDISARGKQIDLTKLLRIDTVSLMQNFIGFELIAGPPQLLRELEIPCTLVDENGDPVSDASDIDGAPPGGALLVARLANASRCMPIRDELAAGDWFDRITIAVGAAVADYGAGSSRIDNVSATYLW